MPIFGPIKRKNLIYYLKQLGFDGPYAGGKHQFMIKDQDRLILPNPHQGDIGKGLLSQILEQAGLDRETWESLEWGRILGFSALEQIKSLQLRLDDFCQQFPQLRFVFEHQSILAR